MVFALSVVLLSGATADAGEGSEATASKERIAKVVSVFAQALHQPDQQFVLFRVLTQDESRKALREGAVDLDRLIEEVTAGYRFDLFENLDSEAVSAPTIMMRLNRPTVTRRTRETSGESFIPKAGSRWILIVKPTGNALSEIIKDPRRIAPVEFYDEFFGMIPLDGDVDRMGEGTPIYADLKRMKSYFQSSKKAAPPDLKSEIGKQILRVALQAPNEPDGKAP